MEKPRDTAEKKPAWQQPRQDQRLSHRTILRFQELADELRDDLNDLPLFKGGDNGTGRVQNVFFVSRDPDYSTSELHGRFYNARLLATFNFNSDADKVWTWLNKRSPDEELLPNLEKLKPLFVAAGRPDEFGKFETAVKTKENVVGVDDYKKAQEAAHNLLIDAVAVLPYDGLLISLFEDKVFFSEPEPNKHTPPAHQCCWFEGMEDDLTLTAVNCFVPCAPPIKGGQSKMRFPDAIANELTGDLDTLFKEFLNAFMRGDKPFDENGDWPYKSPEAPMRGFAVPAYDIWSRNVNGWHGGMVGWVFCFLGETKEADLPPIKQGLIRRLVRALARVFHCVDEVKALPLKAPSTEGNFTWTGLTHAMQHFVRRVRQAHMRELLENFQQARSGDSVEPYFNAHLCHVSGWRWDASPSAKKMPLPRKGTEVSFLTPVSRVWDTVSRGETESFEEAEWLCKQFLDGLDLLHKSAEAERRLGKAQAADEAHEKTAHQIRKLNNRIVGTEDLDTLRHFYNTAFLSPREIEDIGKFASDLTYRFGSGFLDGDTFKDFLRSAFSYAQRLRPLLRKVELNLPKAPSLPHCDLEIATDTVLSSSLWSHVDLMEIAGSGAPINKDDPRIGRLTVKVSFYCALISAFTNALEHCASGTSVKVATGEAGQILVVMNEAEPIPKGADRTLSPKRGSGTAHTLAYYVSIYSREGALSSSESDSMMARLAFADTADTNNIFHTVLPIPRADQLYA